MKGGEWDWRRKDGRKEPVPGGRFSVEAAGEAENFQEARQACGVQR